MSTTYAYCRASHGYRTSVATFYINKLQTRRGTSVVLHQYSSKYKNRSSCCVIGHKQTVWKGAPMVIVIYCLFLNALHTFILLSKHRATPVKICYRVHRLKANLQLDHAHLARVISFDANTIFWRSTRTHTWPHIRTQDISIFDTRTQRWYFTYQLPPKAFSEYQKYIIGMTVPCALAGHE